METYAARKRYNYSLDTKQILCMFRYAKEMLEVPRLDTERVGGDANKSASAVNFEIFSHIGSDESRLQSVNLERLFGQLSTIRKNPDRDVVTRYKQFKALKRYSATELQGLQTFVAGSRDLRQLVHYIDWKIYEKFLCQSSFQEMKDKQGQKVKALDNHRKSSRMFERNALSFKDVNFARVFGLDDVSKASLNYFL